MMNVMLFFFACAYLHSLKISKKNLHLHGSEFVLAICSSFLLKTFAMKKYILSAALLIFVSGFAAAQSTSTKQATKPQEKATIQKGIIQKKVSSKKTVLKQESSASAKYDSVKLVLPPVSLIADSLALPKVKNGF